MKKTVSIVVSSTLLFSLTVGSVYPKSVQAKTAEDYKQQIENNNSQKQELEKEKDKIQSQQKIEKDNLNNIQSELEEKSKELSIAREELDQATKEVNKVKGEVEAVQSKINKLNKSIEENEKSLIETEEDIEEKQDMLSKRIRTMYKMNYLDSVVSIILTSDSFVEGVEKIMSFTYFVKNDRKLIQEVEEMYEELNKKKEELNNNKASLNKEKEIVVEKQKKLEETMALQKSRSNELENQYASIQNLEDKKSNLIETLSEKEKELNDKIGDIASYNSQLQKELDNIFASVNNGDKNDNKDDGKDNSNVTSTGYVRPVSGGYISCPYGPRIHPVHGTPGFHTGIDIAAPTGTPIYASHDGVVGAAQWNAAYGNMVIINGSNGIQTLYGHATSYIVSKGQSVKKGQVIAYVGSTGWSTGPHLHYEVRKNGNHVNPGPYM